MSLRLVILNADVLTSAERGDRGTFALVLGGTEHHQHRTIGRGYARRRTGILSAYAAGHGATLRCPSGNPRQARSSGSTAI